MNEPTYNASAAIQQTLRPAPSATFKTSRSGAQAVLTPGRHKYGAQSVNVTMDVPVDHYDALQFSAFFKELASQLKPE